MKAHGVVIMLALALATLPAASGGDGEPRANAGGGSTAGGESPIVIESEGDITVSGEIDTEKRPPVKVSLAFAKTDVREAIAAIAKLAGVKVDVAEQVKGEVSLTLKDLPWRSALIQVAKAAKAVLLPQRDGSFRIVPTTWFYLYGNGLVTRTAEGKPILSGAVIGRDGKVIPTTGWGVFRGTTAYTLQPPTMTWTTATSDRTLKDLRAALKTLKAAGLAKEAQAVEAEIARREAARKPMVYVASANLTTSIAALRADVAALREEVRELTALVRKLAGEER